MLSSRLNSVSLFLVVMMLPPLLSLCARIREEGNSPSLKRRCVETQNGYASGAFLYQESTR